MPEAEEDPELDAPEGILDHDIAEDVSTRPLSLTLLIRLGNVPDPWHAPRALLGLQYGDGAVQLCANEEILEPRLQDCPETKRVGLAAKVTGG